MSSESEGAERGTLQFPCSLCDKKYDKKKTLDNHFQRNHMQQKFPCLVCSKSFQSARGLKLHVSLVHAAKTFKCDLCSYEATTGESLKKHENEHKERPFTCTICQKLFTSDAELKTHLKTAHTSTKIQYQADPNAPDKTKPYKCTRCDKWCKDIQTVRKHEKQVHDVKLVTCDVCGAQIKGEYKLKTHMARHEGQMNFTCSACGKKFVTKEERTRHEKLKHIADSMADESEETSDVEDKDDGVNSKSSGSERERAGRHQLFSKEAVARNSSLIDKLRNRLSLARVSTLPETPSPAQQVMMGRNLRAFERCHLVEPLPTLAEPTIEPSPNLRHMLTQPSRRQLFTALLGTEGSSEWEVIRVKTYKGNRPMSKDDQYQDLDIASFMLDSNTAPALAKQVKLLLERVPVPLQEVSDNHRNWVLSAATRLIHNDDPSHKVVLPMPEYKKWPIQGRNVFYVAFRVNGYDHARCYPWNRQIEIPLASQVDLSATIPTPDEKIIWKGESGDIPLDGLKLYSREQFEKTLLLAKHLTAYYAALVGSFLDCQADARLQVAKYCIGGAPTPYSRKDTLATSAPLNIAWKHQPIWKFWSVDNHSIFYPSAWFLDRMTARPSSLIVYSVEPERLVRVAQGMLEAVQEGCDEDTVWGIGAAIADEANRLANDTASPLIACNNDKHKKELHVCPGCMQPRQHREFEFTDYSYFPVCHGCHVKHDQTCPKGMIKGGIVGYHLLNQFRKEENIVISKKDLVQQTNNTIDALRFMFISDGAMCYDGYVASSILNPLRLKPVSWDGTKLHPLVPSIDAIDPIVPGEDGLTHYHYADKKYNNIVITGDWINRAKAHYPVVTIHALLLFAEAPDRDKAVYENAIGIMRNCLINHYEYGVFAHSQQSQRIGRPVPQNIDTILRSYRTAELLEKTKPLDMYWRMYTARPLGSLSQRARWRSPHHEWLLRQLRYIETDVFNDSASDLRKYWMRPGADGEDVFWPFSQYSVSTDVTYWGLWEILAVKDVRNITLCQIPHTRGMKLQFYKSEELFLVVANIWLRMVKNDVDSGKPAYDYGRDEAGLIPHPNINSLLCASLGHKTPGTYQDTGLSNFDLDKEDKVIFVPERCGFLWETQTTNFMKWKYNANTFPSIFSALKKIRRGNLLSEETRSLLPNHDLKVPLRDELHALTAAKGTHIGRDNDRFVVDDPPALRQLLRLIARQDQDAAYAMEVTADVDLDSKDFADVAADNETENDDEEDESMFLPSDASFESALAPIPPVGLDQVALCQMSNIGATCYMSSVIHAMIHIHGYAQNLFMKSSMLLDTGRSPRILQIANDPSGLKHTHFRDILADLAKRLKDPGSQLPKTQTQVVLEAISDLDVNKRWKNQDSDPADLFSFVMDALDVVLDRSPEATQSDVNERDDEGRWFTRPAYRPEELLFQRHMVNLSMGAHPSSLQHESDVHWNAHILSGHDSDFARSTAVQYVELSQCDSLQCSVVRRDFQYSSTIRLRFPPGLNDNDAVPLVQLMEQSFTERMTPGPRCPNRLHKSGDNTRLSTKLTRITRVNEVFAVEIERTRPVPDLPEGLNEQQMKDFFLRASDNPFENRIEEFEVIDMDTWANGRDVEEKSMLGEDGPQTEELTHPSIRRHYSICAIVAYSRPKFHYVVFVKIAGRWIYFDDLQPRPVERNPFEDWPQSFIEKLLFYQHSESAEDKEIVAEQASTDPSPSEPEVTRTTSQIMAESIATLKKEVSRLREDNARQKKELQNVDRLRKLLDDELESSDRLRETIKFWQEKARVNQTSADDADVFISKPLKNRAASKPFGGLASVLSRSKSFFNPARTSSKRPTETQTNIAEAGKSVTKFQETFSKTVAQASTADFSTGISRTQSADPSVYRPRTPPGQRTRPLHNPKIVSQARNTSQSFVQPVRAVEGRYPRPEGTSTAESSLESLLSPPASPLPPSRSRQTVARRDRNDEHVYDSNEMDTRSG